MTSSLAIPISLATVAIALAGFAAVVMLLRRGDSGRWAADDADRFHRMVVHAICAVAFSFLPYVLNVVVQDVVTTIHIACVLLGAQLVVHSVAVMNFSTPQRLGYLSLALGILIGALQFTAFTDWGVQREMDLYLVGIIWHILQAGLLFVLLIWIPPQQIQDRPDSDNYDSQV